MFLTFRFKAIELLLKIRPGGEQMYNLREQTGLGRAASVCAHTLCKIKWKSKKSGSFLQLSIALIATQGMAQEREITRVCVC